MRREAITSGKWFNSFKETSIDTTRVNVLFFSLILGLVIFGLIMVYSSSFIFAEQRTGNGYTLIGRQSIFALLGLGTLYVASLIPYLFWSKFAYPLLLFSMALLILTLVPGIGVSAGGADRWIEVVGSYRFQPGELTKFTVIAFVARQLSKKDDRLDRFVPGVLSHFIVTSPVFVLLLLQPDFGSAMIIAIIMFIMFFLAGVPKRFLFFTGTLAIGVASFLVLTSAYRKSRLLAFLDPWNDPLGRGFQILQSFVGFHHGSIWGVGLGNGKEKLFYLPEAHNDFIFAVIGEELGFVGVGAVVAVFLGVLYCGFKLSWKAFLKTQDRFALYLGTGLTLLIGVQAFMNMAVVLGLLPTKGLALPFISYGGSALLINLFCAGVILSVAKGKSQFGKARASLL
jgi:cell division protein FtsW